MECKTPVFHGEMELKAKGTAGGGEGDKGREEHVPWCRALGILLQSGSPK